MSERDRDVFSHRDRNTMGNTESLVNSITVIELQHTAKDMAIRELVSAGCWSADGISDEKLLSAIGEREESAQTIVAPELAIPHASIDWDGGFRIVLGRSRQGVEYGAAGETVSLVALLITGRDRQKQHLKVLAGLADLLRSAEFRQQLIDAENETSIRVLLRERAGLEQHLVPSISEPLPELSIMLAHHAVHLAKSMDIQAMLIAVDRPESVPWEVLTNWPGRLLVVVTDYSDDITLSRANIHIFNIPHSSLSRIDRANLGMLLAASNGLLSHDTDVVCVTGPPGQRLDCVAVIRPTNKFHTIFRENIEQGTAHIPPAVILRVLSIAIELSSEGREGKAVGTMFVIGDTRQVKRRARQLVLNPFHGFSDRLRNILDPVLAETIKEFAGLDGAFVVRIDGTMLSAGTYLIPETSSGALPGGLGARHQAAASITARTKAMAITVSQSTGTVTIFQNGGSVLSLERASLTRW